MSVSRWRLPGVVVGLLLVLSHAAPLRAEGAPRAVVARILAMLSAGGKLPKVQERGEALLQYSAERVEGWELRLIALRARPAARWVQVSAPPGRSIDPAALGAVSPLCDLTAGAAAHHAYELSGKRGVFIDRVQPPGGGVDHVDVFNTDYIRSEQSPLLGRLRACLALKSKL